MELNPILVFLTVVKMSVIVLLSRGRGCSGSVTEDEEAVFSFPEFDYMESQKNVSSEEFNTYVDLDRVNKY